MMNAPDDAGRPRFGRMLGAVAAGVGAIFMTGFAVGGGRAFAEGDGLDAPEIVIIGASLVVAALCGWAAYALWQRRTEQPLSPRTRQANKWFNWSMVVGGALGLLLGLSFFNTESPFALFGEGPLPALPVALTVAVYLLAVPVLTWRWWVNIDEHEADAYRFGALSAGTFYLFVTPSWWLSWRGGFVPEPPHMLIFLAVTAVWLIGWAWRRYR